jgi:mannose-6-phosphate isomerase-like protein (cupin superfamily)
MNWNYRYASDARAKRIMDQLRKEYPGAEIIDDAGSYFALTEPTKDHPEYDGAVQVVVGPTPPHHHEHTSHEYRARQTPFNLHMDDQVIRVEPGQTHHVPPGTVHYLSVDPDTECWLDVIDRPGLDDDNPDAQNV